MQEICNFQKTYKRENSHISFRFVGKESIENTNVLKKQALIDKCFDKISTFNSSNIRRCIIWLRTILRDYEEEFLKISIGNVNEKIQVEFNNKKLSCFKLEDDVYSKNKFTTTYSTPYNFHTFISKNSECEETIKRYEEKERKSKNLIASLEDCYILSEDMYIKDENICEFYKLFYNENPDFASKEINTKIQVMYYILQYFYIDMTYAFDGTIQNSLMPFSTKLQMDVEMLTPFGRVEVNEEEIKIQEIYKRKIKTIGEMIKQQTNFNMKKLLNFAIILFEEEKESRYKNSDLETIANTTGIDLEHVIDNLKLVRKIKEMEEQSSLEN